MIWLFYCLAAMVLWGLWAFLPKFSTRHLDTHSALIFQQLGAVAAGLCVLAAMKFRVKVEWTGISYAFLTGVLGVVGLIFYLQAVTRYRLSVVVPVTSMYPVVTILLSLTILREKISPVQWLGVFFALLAIVLISWPSR